MKVIRAVIIALAMIVASIAAIAPAQSKPGDCYGFARSQEQINIMKKESHGNPRAKNPRSSAFGCGQLLYGNRVKHHAECGGPPDSVSVRVQMCAMSRYIDDRYGSDAKAWQFKQIHGTY